MRTTDIPIYNVDQATVPEDRDSPPKRRFTTPWIPCHLGLFRVDLAIVGPESKKSKRYFSLSRCQTKRICQAISDVVEFLKKELR